MHFSEMDMKYKCWTYICLFVGDTRYGLHDRTGKMRTCHPHAQKYTASCANTESNEYKKQIVARNWKFGGSSIILLLKKHLLKLGIGILSDKLYSLSSRKIILSCSERMLGLDNSTTSSFNRPSACTIFSQVFLAPSFTASNLISFIA